MAERQAISTILVWLTARMETAAAMSFIIEVNGISVK